jgi:hypothetical protein
VAPAEGLLTEAVLKHARVCRTAAHDPTWPFPDRNGKVSLGAGRAIPNEKPEWPRSADSGRSRDRGLTSQIAPEWALRTLTRRTGNNHPVPR